MDHRTEFLKAVNGELRQIIAMADDFLRIHAPHKLEAIMKKRAMKGRVALTLPDNAFKNMIPPQTSFKEWEAFKNSLTAEVRKELEHEIGSLEIALKLALDKHAKS